MVRMMMITAVLAISPLLALGQDPVTERPNGATPQKQVQPAPQQNNANPKPAPRIQPQPIRLPGSMWGGTEDFNNNGRLGFALASDGRAVMLDARGLVNGTWSSQGNKVTIRFTNCVYEGTVNQGAITGRATLTAGANTGDSWNFHVMHDDPFRGREYRGSENLGGFGALTFRFGIDGSVEMIDAQSRVRGTYSLDLNRITIRFDNCVYTGMLQNNRVTGTAHYTQGGQGNPWTFEVALPR